MGGLGQVGYGPLERVDGPPPLRPRYGLLQAAEAPAAGVRLVVDSAAGPIDQGDPTAAEIAQGWGIKNAGQERWLNGVEVFPYPPDVADVYDPCGQGSNPAPKGFGTTLLRPQFGAMTIWLAETCTASRVWNQEEFKARAVAALNAVEGAAVASELMRGTRIPLNPFFADGGGTFPTGNTVLSPKLALATLEDEIAKSARAGLIHTSPGMTAILQDHFWLDSRTGVLRTINGTVIIPDAGYVTPPKPAGATHSAAGANQEWMYATGPIDIRRSETFTTPDTVAQAIDLGISTVGAQGATSGRPNAITYRAERYYLAVWDKEVQAAVLVDRTL